MKYLLDSNILIYAFKGLGNVRQHMSNIKDIDFALAAPVLFELQVGCLKSNRADAQAPLLADAVKRFTFLPFDMACTQAAASVRAYLESQGTPIGPIDNMIAGTALAHDLTVVTRNTREFSQVPNLKVENWYD